MTKHKKANLPGVFSIFRPLFTIVVLTAFVLGISFLVKTISTSNSSDVLALIHPVLARLHIDDTKAGEVAGAFISRISQTGVVGEINTSSENSSQSATDAPTSIAPDAPQQPDTQTSQVNPADVSFNIAILADSHSNYDNLGKALTLAKSQSAKVAFFLGDYTDLGVIDDLTTAKKTMDAGGIEYHSLPGDHDLWKAVGPENFIEVFGKNYFTKTVNGLKFVGLDNSANYTVIPTEEMAWFTNQLVDADFVLLSQPLYSSANVALSQVVMGITNGQVNQPVREQALEILKMIRDSKVKAIIAGDQHMSSQETDPTKPELQHIVVGALTNERNLQTPRFSVLHIMKDGSFVIEDVVLQ